MRSHEFASKRVGMRLVCILVSALGQMHSNCSASARAPNIVLILVDDQQFNALAANENPLVETKTMDEIARRGVRFTQARAALPVCSPSRATILTGQYNNTNGVEKLGQSIRRTAPRLGVLLQDAGYATGVTGKWHLGKLLDHHELGFDYFATFDSNGDYYRDYNNISDSDAPKKPRRQHVDAYSADRSCDFIDQSLAANKPFFLWHNTQTPHLNGKLVWDALPENTARYDVTDFFDADAGVCNLPGNWNDQLENKPAYYLSIRNYTLAQTDRRYLYGDPLKLARHTRDYYAVISELDGMLASLMRKLAEPVDPTDSERRIIDNTYVLFMSDNGWLMGDHGMTSKSLPFDQSARVPLLVVGPGVDVGRVDNRQVSNVDIAPTVLNMAGATIPAEMQGKSFFRLLSDNGSGPPVRRTNIVEIWESTFAGNKPILAGYDGRYELFYTYENTDDARPSFVEIYDTCQDPWELHNLAGTIRENSEAYQHVLAIHADIQVHRVDILDAAPHDVTF